MNEPLYRTIRKLSNERIKIARELVVLYERLYEKEDKLCEINYQIEKLEDSIDLKKYLALNERDRKIVDLRNKGLSLKEIAEKVGLSYGTVKNCSMTLPKDV